MTQKKTLGQFNTTRKDYILSGFEPFVFGKKWIDPFAGNGDLLQWVRERGADGAIGYDIDETKGFSVRDTLTNPLDYRGMWVIANPPYLRSNRTQHTNYKNLFETYQVDDLYKIAIKTISDSAMGCLGGILIVPLNFLSAVRDEKIRQHFFSEYRIVRCKVFHEQVFDDTDYTICAFSFVRQHLTEYHVPVLFEPNGNTIHFDLSKKTEWVFGQKFYQWLGDPDISFIGRWTTENCYPSAGLFDDGVATRVACVDFSNIQNMRCTADIKKNIILLRAIDSGTPTGRIKLEDIRSYGVDVVLGLTTSRNLATIRFEHPPSITMQLKIIEVFNQRLEHFREMYESMFLTNFRHSSKWYARKRISFRMAYQMIQRILESERLTQPDCAAESHKTPPSVGG